jgi:diguanylate cyclase (GGDEF)-like protein
MHVQTFSALLASPGALLVALALSLAGAFAVALGARLRAVTGLSHLWTVFGGAGKTQPPIEPLPRRTELMQLSRGLEATNGRLRSRLNELSLLYEVARSFTSTLELPEVLARISTLIAEKLQIPHFSIMLANGEGELVVKSAYPAGRGTEGRKFQIGEGACGRAARTRRVVSLPDLAADREIFVSRSDGKIERGSLLAVPMVHRETLLGVLNFQRPQLASFSPEEIEVLTTIADQGAMAIKNALLHEQMVALSITDPLTGISNRRHLSSRLEMEIDRANRFGSPISVLMIDIDLFKRLNDAAGHRVGDIVLKQLARLLRSVTRRVDTLARYGGEEFVVVLPQVPKAEALQVAEKLRRTVEDYNFGLAEDEELARVTISLGVANLPVDGESAERLLDCADAALYASKRAGRNQVTGYAAGMELLAGRERSPHPGRRRRPSGGENVLRRGTERGIA